MPPPTNISAETALAISAGQTFTADITDLPEDLHLWFRYTGRSLETTISVSGKAPVTSPLSPAVTAWTGTIGSLTVLAELLGINNAPMIVPVSPGQVVYFEMVQEALVSANAPLSFNITQTPSGIAPVETIFINDDSPAFPATFVSGTTGAVLGYSPFPSGEAGNVLPDGTLLLEDAVADTVKIYGPDWRLQATVPISMTGIVPVTTNKSDTFYVASGGSVYVVSAAGTIERVITIPGVINFKGLGVSPDESILYFTPNPTSVVKAWDLGSDTLIGTLTASEPHNVAEDLIALSDGSIVVSFLSGYAKRYSDAGVELNNYTLMGTTMHLADAIDGTSFWVWFQDYGTQAVHTFQNIRASDGAILHEATTPIFTGGSSDDDIADDAPIFGAASSCPFIITRTPFTIPTPVTEPPPPPCVCVPPPRRQPTFPPPIPKRPTKRPPIIGAQLACTGRGSVPTQPDLVYVDAWWDL